MEQMDWPAALLVGIFGGLTIKIVGDYFIRKRNNKNGNPGNPGKMVCPLNQDWIKDAIASVEKNVATLNDQHSVKDEDGTPIWYVPRRLLTEIRDQNKDMGKTLGRMENSLKTIAERHKSN